MNTAGQAGAFPSPIVPAFVVQRFTSWSAPLYIMDGPYLAGSLCWLWTGRAAAPEHWTCTEQ